MQDLFVQLFKKNMNDAGNRAMLSDITKQYPYFTAAHFFLLKNTGNDESDHDNIAAKTSLHFSNAFLLNYRLNKQDIRIDNEAIKPEIKMADPEVLVTAMPKEETKMEAIKPEPVNEEKKAAEMIFEPLFATDYFASQGIKLSEEVQPADKLGKQLKSFTEWLKSMKKVHETKAPAEAIQIDLAVQNLAEKSNQEDEILTESMAEAYLQQGKLKKAVETFEKLSLLNPAKSAYFAAKIEKISTNQ